MTDTADDRTADHELLIRFYPGGATVDIRQDGRWVPSPLAITDDPTEGFDPAEYRNAVSEVVEAGAWLTHVIDVANGVAV